MMRLAQQSLAKVPLNNRPPPPGVWKTKTQKTKQANKTKTSKLGGGGGFGKLRPKMKDPEN